VRKLIFISIILVFVSIASAANEYKTTYTIEVKEDGSAFWAVEYRTLLMTKDELDSFENYSSLLESIYIPEFKTLMENSASDAAAATSRNMVVKEFTGDAMIQSTLTGKYGVVHYFFTWTNFARRDSNINIGDAFVGGLYLSKDNTLILLYPSGFTVDQVNPAPDQIRNGLIWYGLRSFGAGEPKVVLKKESLPWMPIVIVIIIIAILGIIYLRKYKKKIHTPAPRQWQKQWQKQFLQISQRPILWILRIRSLNSLMRKGGLYISQR